MPASLAITRVPAGETHAEGKRVRLDGTANDAASRAGFAEGSVADSEGTFPAPFACPGRATRCTGSPCQVQRLPGEAGKWGSLSRRSTWRWTMAEQADNPLVPCLSGDCPGSPPPGTGEVERRKGTVGAKEILMKRRWNRVRGTWLGRLLEDHPALLWVGLVFAVILLMALWMFLLMGIDAIPS